MNNTNVKLGFYAKYIKRLLDFVLSLLALIVLSPVFALLCILVRIKLGSPIFFKQTRAGKDEKSFEMIKFRTMTDARDELGNLLPDTDRFTKFGDFLRTFSLDELPELLNVLKGDMSLIGPRPLYTFYLPYYTEEEALRHTVRGGITGLAQVNGRALCRWNDRFAYDVNYVKNISFINDVKILWQTIYKVFKKSDIGIPSVTDEGGLHILRDIQRPDKVKEIGSSFSGYFSDSGSLKMPENLTSEKANTVFLSTGRSCIREILKSIDDNVKRAIVPSFTCESVIEPFVENGYEVFPYSLNADLTLYIEALEQQIKTVKPSVLLFHRYFGFDTCKRINDVIAPHKEIVTIEDETQFLFDSKKASEADYQIASIRKWLPVPDGAYLSSNKELIAQPTAEDLDFVRIEQKAMSEKQAHLDNKSYDQSYQQIFADGRNYIDSQKQTFSISKVSNSILGSTDWEKFRTIRKDNASILLESLQNYSWFNCVFHEISDNTVPFMIPLLVHERRSDFQKYLASQKIYATIIWSCPDSIKDRIGTNENMIYNEILCIPCDQRYSADDMNRIVLAVQKFDRKMRMAHE